MTAYEQIPHAHEVARSTRLVHVLSSLTVQLTALLFLLGLVLWTALFISYPLLHDPLHALRHALYVIPCH
ncbi:MAG TPA: CbtB-domain containing protein [Solirubrobacteraceae bacterium]|nr:CbtB-domain containing protein [Solirubrobacteraceae bacterium]